MKILYVGTELAEAQAIATAVSSLGECVRASWAFGLEQVAKWIDENHGLCVLVVEAQPDGSEWRSVLTYAAGLPTALPVVVIVPQEIASDLQPLALDVHECVARNPSLLRNLPAAITRAIDQAQQRQVDRAVRADLELKLVQATAIIQEAEHHHQSAIAAAAEQLAKSQSQYETGMARAAATRDMVDEQFREAAIEVERVRLRHASAVADSERLARREAELSVLLGSATTRRAVLERRLADAETALLAGEARTAEERRNVAELVAEQQRDFERKISEEIDKRRDVEDTLAQAFSAGSAAEQRHQWAMKAAAGESREQQAALSAARQKLESKAAHLDALATREAELTSMLTAATTSRETLERRSEATETALLDANARATRELMVAGKQAAEREAELEDQIRQERAAAVASLLEREASLTSELTNAHAALREEQQRRDTALAMAAGELAERQSHFDHERAEADAERAGLTAQLRDVEESRDQARGEHQSAVADLTRLTERETELEGRLKEGRVTRDALEQAVADAAAARLDERQRHDAALATAAGELAERQAHFEGERAQAEAERAGLAAQLREVEEARDQARREHQSAVADVTRLTGRETELEGRLKEECETRDALEQAVADAAAALRDEQQRRAAAVATAAGELAERQAHFERERAEAEARLAGLTAQLREVEKARDQARGEHQSAVADVTRLTEREAELEGRLKEGRVTRDALEQAVADAAAALRDQQQRHDIALATAAGELAERQAHFERERAEAGAERAGLTAQLREVEEALDQARREHQSAVADVTRLTEDAAAERETAAASQADLEARMNALRAAALVQAAEFDERRREYECRLAEAEDVSSTLARERFVLQQSLHATQEKSHRLEEARNGLQHSLDCLTREHAAVLATRENDIEQLRISLKARVEELEVTRRQREVLQAAADQPPGLQHELHQSRADNHRLFQQGPLPMFRCTKDGVLTQANRMLTILVGGRSAEELRGTDLAAATFESPSDLSWLIERCLGSRGKESTETTWRRQDGSRLLVRLSACATSSDLIECGVEDLTPIRVLHDRLSQAHRMEAVGRLATEVAVTCGSLLGGVRQNAQQWLMTDGSPPASRYHLEMLLEEISRAAGLLGQLAAYGDEESRRPAVVELGTVVRDVAPVLKRVAGDAVEVQLPAASAPLNVDAGAERVKRLLVNLAAYGRERMPFGGRLKIELGTIVVDRHFAAKHPNVRLGPHALVTVTESRRATRTDGPLQHHDNEAGSSARSVAVQTGVDLGTLQELVAECGGHLWMTVEPVGDMVVKIRLPLVTPYGEPPRRTSAPGGRVRTLGQWLQP